MGRAWRESLGKIQEEVRMTSRKAATSSLSGWAPELATPAAFYRPLHLDYRHSTTNNNRINIQLKQLGKTDDNRMPDVQLCLRALPNYISARQSIISERSGSLGIPARS